MPTLYVIEPGARLEKEYGRLLVTKDDELLLRVPLQRVTQVVLVGQVGVTTPALYALLHAGVPLLLVTRSGSLRGRLLPPAPRNLPLRQQQFRRNDEADFCLNLSRAIVLGKLHNQRTLALRLLRRRAALAGTYADDLAAAIQQAAAAPDLDTLRGIEGSGARIFFHLYRQAFGPQWRFERRTRRPPRDPVNALLSLGYTFLTQAMMTALETVGLDPYLGYFHAEAYGRPALALDLVEEFRTPVVDSLVLMLLNRRTLQLDDFEPDPETGGVVLTPAGLRRFLARFSVRLDRQIQSRELDRALSYRKLFEVQARKLARAIQEDEPYRPFRAR